MDEDPVAPPCAERFLAATLMLMSHFPGAVDAAPPMACQQRAMACRIVSNLFFLMSHPDVAPSLRPVLVQAHTLWVARIQALERALHGPGDVTEAAMADDPRDDAQRVRRRALLH
jgi:hypothetical protein